MSFHVMSWRRTSAMTSEKQLLLLINLQRFCKQYTILFWVWLFTSVEPSRKFPRVPPQQLHSKVGLFNTWRYNKKPYDQQATVITLNDYVHARTNTYGFHGRVVRKKPFLYKKILQHDKKNIAAWTIHKTSLNSILWTKPWLVPMPKSQPCQYSV